MELQPYRGSKRRTRAKPTRVAEIELQNQEVRRRDFAVAAGLQVIGDLLSLAQAGKARAFYGRNVHERIFGTIIGLDEAKAFG